MVADGLVVNKHGIDATGYTALIARFMGPTWGPSGTDRTQVGPMLAPGTLLSGVFVFLRRSAAVKLNNPSIHWKFGMDN